MIKHFKYSIYNHLADQAAWKVELDWLMGVLHMKAVWRSVSMIHGGLSVKVDGMLLMQELYADN